MKHGNLRPGISHELYADLMKKITSGQLPQGSVMPTVRSLAEAYKTSVNTVQRVMARLEADGYVKCRLGRNNVVMSAQGQVHETPAERASVVILGVDNATAEDCVMEWPYLWGQEVGSGVSSALHAQGINCFQANLQGEGPGRVPDLKEIVLSRFSSVSGVILFPALSLNLTSAAMADFPVPLVTINRAGLWQSANFVTADYISVGRQIADAFASQGLDRVLLMGSLSYSQSWRELCMGFLEREMEQGRGLSGIHSLETPKASEPGGYAEIRRYLAGGGEAPEAVVAAGDYLALGAIRALQESGLRVPEDVKVIGGAGDEMSEFTNPPLSVVAQPAREVGVRAGSLMARLIQEKSHALPGVVVPTGISWRQSAPVHVPVYAPLAEAQV